MVFMIGLSDCLDFDFSTVGKGAVAGPGEVRLIPNVLISSGWKSPLRTEFLVYRELESGIRNLH